MGTAVPWICSWRPERRGEKGPCTLARLFLVSEQQATYFQRLAQRQPIVIGIETGARVPFVTVCPRTEEVHDHSGLGRPIVVLAQIDMQGELCGRLRTDLGSAGDGDMDSYAADVAG